MDALNKTEVEVDAGASTGDVQVAHPDGLNRNRSMPPPVTLAIMVICTLVWAALNFLPAGEEARVLNEFLAPSAVAIWAGAYWALLTTAFVHVDFVHGLFNIWWTKEFGKLMEPRLGSGRYFLFVSGTA